MKKGYIVSAILGGGFFAVPYLALGVPIWGAGIMAGAAFGAGMLIFGRDKENKLDFSFDGSNHYEILKNAKENVTKLKELSKQLEKPELIKTVKDICEISDKIIDTLSKKPEKMKQAHNFISYYLPATIEIINRYDEIENQRLTTNDSKKFMQSVENKMETTKIAFGKLLGSLYQSDIVDTDAEIKVFEQMLKMDGYMDEKDFDIKEED